MGKSKTYPLDEIVKLAEDFVTKQKGKWDHAAWLDFLSTLKKKGYDLSGEVQTYLGQVLEAMKGFYKATASVGGIEKALASVATDSVTFVKEHKAVWGHNDWEAFVGHIQKTTLNLSEEATGYLGGLLEAFKPFYQIASIPQASDSKPPSTKKASSPKKEASAPAEKKRSKASESNAADDLTAITGIGPALQKKLNDHGIHRFSQIAALSEKEIEGLEENIIKFSGRIKRDDWVGQAKRFEEEKARQ